MIAAALILVACFPFSNADVRPCKENSQDLNECIKNALNDIIPTLAEGNFNLSGIDPLVLDSVETSYNDDNISLFLVTKNGVITGFSNARVQTVKSKNLYMGKLEIIMKVPEIVALGSYMTEGYISTFPLSSQGQFNVTMDEVTLVWIIYLERLQTDGGRLKVVNLSLDAIPEQIYIEPAETIDGDNKLGETLSVYLNQNSYELFNLVKPRLMRFTSDMFKDLINAYLFNIPDNKMFVTQ